MLQIKSHAIFLISPLHLTVIHTTRRCHSLASYAIAFNGNVLSAPFKYNLAVIKKVQLYASVLYYHPPLKLSQSLQWWQIRAGLGYWMNTIHENHGYQTLPRVITSDSWQSAWKGNKRRILRYRKLDEGFNQWDSLTVFFLIYEKIKGRVS